MARVCKSRPPSLGETGTRRSAAPSAPWGPRGPDGSATRSSWSHPWCSTCVRAGALDRVKESICYPAALMSPRRRPIVGVTNWDPADDNQYLDRLTSALRSEGIAVLPVRLAPLQIAWKAAFGMRAVHVHWPEYLVRPFNRTRAGAALNGVRLARGAAGLAACRPP